MLVVAVALLLLACLDARAVRQRLTRDRRRREVRWALPTFVDALAAALGSGLSLPLAFVEIAPTLAPELAEPTRRAAADLALGVRVADAMNAYRGAAPDDDIAPVTVVLASFERSGGRIAASLERVSALLRGRLALEEERTALLAQSRASATVLVALAPLGAVFFSLAMPDYIAELTGDGLGLLVIALGFEIAGALWLWRIVRAQADQGDLAMFLDAVVIGLDAGLTFEHALRALLDRAPTLSRASRARMLLADLSLGVPLPEALRGFALRPDETRIAALVAASMRFGAPLARLLVLQADAIRATERHRSEARARRLPVLMLFPLSLCILPALLIVFLGPPLVSLLH